MKYNFTNFPFNPHSLPTSTLILNEENGIHLKRRKFPIHVYRDGVKCCLVLPRVVLDCLGAWPEKKSKPMLFLSIYVFFGFIFTVYGNCTFIVQNITDITTCVCGVTVLLVGVQAVIRQLLLLYYQENISFVLSTIYTEFWSANIAGSSFQKKISKETFYLNAICFFYVSTGTLCAVQYVFPFLIKGKGELPLFTSYYFVEEHGILYNIVYVWQGYACVTFPLFVCGFDMLFASLVWNCISQLKFLGHLFSVDLGSAMKSSVALEPKRNDTAMRMMLTWIIHHQKVIQICREIETIFTLFVLVLVLSNILTLCSALFILVVLPAEFGKMLTYLAGFSCELMLCSFVGAELISASTSLSDAIFKCGWHLSDTSKNLKTSIMMVMLRSQKEVRLTIGGFGTLNLNTFVEVLRLSFSLFTVLNSLLQRKNLTAVAFKD